MITYQNLGKYGRLGNQMFQYAALLGISNKTGYQFGFSPGRLLENFKISMGMPLNEKIPVKYLYEEKDFNFTSEVFQCPDDVDFIGYFQSEKYWKHCQELVVQQFQFINVLEINDTFTSLHVRRGDYVSLKDTHTCLADTNYYDIAIKELNPKKIVVFTDDQEWLRSSGCLERWRVNREVEISNYKNDILELLYMTKADNSIIANSSFSWWGAYLGPHQKKGTIIAPKNWFGPKGPRNWQDIYCDGWVIL